MSSPWPFISRLCETLCQTDLSHVIGGGGGKLHLCRCQLTAIKFRKKISSPWKGPSSYRKGVVEGAVERQCQLRVCFPPSLSLFAEKLPLHTHIHSCVPVCVCNPASDKCCQLKTITAAEGCLRGRDQLCCWFQARGRGFSAVVAGVGWGGWGCVTSRFSPSLPPSLQQVFQSYHFVFTHWNWLTVWKVLESGRRWVGRCPEFLFFTPTHTQINRDTTGIIVTAVTVRDVSVVFCLRTERERERINEGMEKSSGEVVTVVKRRCLRHCHFIRIFSPYDDDSFLPI